MNHLGAGRRFYNDLTGGGRRKHAKTRFLLRLRWGHVTGVLGGWGGVPALQESPEHAGVPVDGGRL